MTSMFFEGLTRPLTEATIIAAIIAGIVMALVYWRSVKVQMYNGVIFNAMFFISIYVARRVDGIPTAAGYIGVFILYLIFIYSAWLTHELVEKYNKRKK